MNAKDKVLAWLKRIGIVSILYVPGFFFAWSIGYKMIAGACLGIFIYINFNVLWKLFNNLLTKLVKLW